MRISTTQLFYERVTAMLEQQAKLSKTEIQLATGKRVLTASDDPAGSVRNLQLGDQLSQLQQYQKNVDISTSRLNQEEGVFLDLRDAADYKQSHIVDAVNIPATKLVSRLVELEKYKNKPVVLVCKMGQQSGAAGKQLKEANFERVYKMSGGMMEWSNLQLPTVA